MSFLHAIVWLDASRDMTSFHKASFFFAKSVAYGVLFTDEANCQAIRTKIFSFTFFVNDLFLERLLAKNLHFVSGVRVT